MDFSRLLLWIYSIVTIMECISAEPKSWTLIEDIREDYSAEAVTLSINCYLCLLLSIRNCDEQFIRNVDSCATSHRCLRPSSCPTLNALAQWLTINRSFGWLSLLPSGEIHPHDNMSQPQRKPTRFLWTLQHVFDNVPYIFNDDVVSGPTSHYEAAGNVYRWAL